jgi:PAS domain-containing protein
VDSAIVTPDELLACAVNAMKRGGDALREVLEPSPLPVYAVDPEGLVIFANRACGGFAGRSPQPGQDRWCVTWKLFATDGSFLPHDRCPMAVAVKERRGVRGVEAFAERPDGSRARFRPLPTPVFDDDGELLGAVNILVDLSQEDQAKHLSGQASKCRRLARSIADARTAETLRLMAAEYEEKVRELRRPN